MYPLQTNAPWARYDLKILHTHRCSCMDELVGIPLCPSPAYRHINLELLGQVELACCLNNLLVVVDEQLLEEEGGLHTCGPAGMAQTVLLEGLAL